MGPAVNRFSKCFTVGPAKIAPPFPTLKITLVLPQPTDVFAERFATPVPKHFAADA